MFSFLRKIIKYKTHNAIGLDENIDRSECALSSSLNKNLTMIKNVLAKCDDLIIRDFNLNNDKKTDAALLFISEMVSKSIIYEGVLAPLIYDNSNAKKINPVNENIDYISKYIITADKIRKISTIEGCIDECLSGNTVLFIDGFNESLVVSTKESVQRSIEEPETEVVVRGPREGFCEDISTNITLIRRKIKNPGFKFRLITMGSRTKTKIGYCYIEELTDSSLVQEVEKRLNSIKTDSILESGYIEQFIEDAPNSIFATIANSEKPDVVASKILEGKIAILTDGTPMVLTLPMTFNESFESAEDYYSRPYYASFIRILRFFAFGLSILAPAIYVALISFHQELIPTPLLITTAAAQEGTPFPSVIEAFLMAIAFEIIKEAGIRLPRPIGSTVSIVGALVIGEAAVTAGLVGAPMVIVIALTAICSFIVPSQSAAGSILMFLFIFLAGVMGVFGIISGILFVFIHLCSLRSFGIPYLYPIAPVNIKDLKKVLIKPPIWKMDERPAYLKNDIKRQGTNQKPTPPSDCS